MDWGQGLARRLLNGKARNAVVIVHWLDEWHGDHRVPATNNTRPVQSRSNDNVVAHNKSLFIIHFRFVS